ncbi:Crp/Fnr family transcriptional regulator [Hyphococcus luteus]|uniref:Crp/Fnr family transcriptional regulator n=1 Tax=Hyphococcus luteus TaxID=2058213 RepID=A0A2S7K8Q8_9PROT|nr:cyclic nucleotide-binding domain-containing protein [Marinicaulis flavus]PQA88886.1 Crp/Fnr family transcriptional regulator [Marinicaulis flavus]
MAEKACTAPTRPQSCDLCAVREHSICADLGPREFAQVEKTMARRHVDRGKAIMAEGEPNDSLYVVVDGSFRLSKILEDGRRQVTGFLFPGDFAGVRATGSNAYTAEALEQSTVCFFPHKFLEDVAADAPGVKDRLIARGQTEYHKAQDHIVLLGKKTAEERVISFIYLVDRAVGADAGPGKRRVPLPMPRQDIADYLGLRLETLSRTLTALKRDGRLYDLTRHEVIIAAGPDRI